VPLKSERRIMKVYSPVTRKSSVAELKTDEACTLGGKRKENFSVSEKVREGACRSRINI